jgi:hypothetical protein
MAALWPGRAGWALAVAPFAVLAATATLGCGLEASTGVHVPGPTTLPYSLALGGRLHHPRGTGGFAGGHVLLTDPTPEASFGVRQVVGTAGYRFVSSTLGTEVGAEAGVGEPPFERYPGPGMYSGGMASLLLRTYGDQDVEPGFAPAAVLADFVLTGRVGAWIPPSGAADRAATAGGALHVGYRVTLISDAIDVTGKELEP